MRAALTSIGVATLFGLSSAWAQAPSVDAPARVPAGHPPSRSDLDVVRLLHYEPTGLSLLRPYRRGRIPVVLVHGLWSSPWSWSTMVEALEADGALRERYQFWTFGYSTGDPILYSAGLLRRNLDEARRTLDPERTDAAFDRAVVVGHSMGGLLAKMMVQESGSRVWHLASDRPFEELTGEPEDRDLFRYTLFFKPRPEVRRVVFIATPHRGSHADRGGVERLGARLVRIEEPLRAAFARLVARNGPAFFSERVRGGLPTSIEELEWGSPALTALSELGLTAGVPAHSIIADPHDPPRAGGSDGLVPYESAHLDGVASEVLVSSGHLCQGHPAVIREVRRILAAHADPPASDRPPAAGAP
jgi:pimeloyl-ACP methyl ester carboxylesterase